MRSALASLCGRREEADRDILGVPNMNVWYKPNSNFNVWKKATIEKQLGSNTYLIKLNGKVIKAHRNQLRTSYMQDVTDNDYDPEFPRTWKKVRQNSNQENQVREDQGQRLSPRPQRMRRPPQRFSPT